MPIFVQFTDSSETKIQSLFSCKQDESILNQGIVEPDDKRYIEFYSSLPDSVKVVVNYIK